MKQVQAVKTKLTERVKADHQIYLRAIEMIEAEFDDCKAILFKRGYFSSSEQFVQHFAKISSEYSWTFEEILYFYLRDYAQKRLFQLIDDYEKRKEN